MTIPTAATFDMRIEDKGRALAKNGMTFCQRLHKKGLPFCTFRLAENDHAVFDKLEKHKSAGILKFRDILEKDIDKIKNKLSDVKIIDEKYEKGIYYVAIDCTSIK